MLKKIFKKLWLNAYKSNEDNILSLMNENENARIIDLGCDDGDWTIKISRKIKPKIIYGVDVISEQLEMAKAKGIETFNCDLNKKLPFADESFDVIHANQVIEHISDLDLFLSELYRILKKGGYAVVSTENASSWCNIMAAILGWQIFSLTNITRKKRGIGNPLAVHRESASGRIYASWTHKTVMNYLGLIELFETYNFDVSSVLGSSYFPFLKIFLKFDKRHSHFITIKAYKK